MRAEDIIERLDLEPLPVEGGFFRRYWAGPGDPPAGSAIWFLLTDGPGGNSRFHCLTLDEVWHRYLGDPAELVLLEPDKTSRHVRLGPDLDAGDVVTHAVPARTWVAARTLGHWSLLGTTMAPAFTPECFEAANPQVLAAGWPHEATTIAALG